ncbi:MAG: DUF2058 domain-containing protein [gamma proteobacterium symbiont of Bathyaustriella thionipta]|nr:DUF2058 domain-containing protein [gamma proteobacterium symbiont of Bathyaustriella thionipta]MCU7949247.1 DUF2058 domain-containing protein [gamma proteobacterium symbiont of Bathyaustriella thionipta]MCU7953671.1 DUF2058 domain-containing protein [gamma proteobacterium symbiont of Bathyaustriella thionipta]MCU7955835.1 DUF2058 domain-containing protein [gamma proteobacterium symbiont of Bathyaustriella thionipta]MCU7966937.1 DUF2058 domain-containing protein [gamma proteobacterium symbion
MGNALQDQLLKAGLVDKNKANRAKNAKHKKMKHQRSNNQVVVDEAKLLAEKSIKEKSERDRELNRQRNEKAQQKAIIAQIKQLINVNKMSKGNGDDLAYNFEDNKNIKRIYVTQDSHDAIAQGKLAIVKLEGQYEIVPGPVADKIKLRDESYIILRNDPSQSEEEADDFYSDYEIPDDLMW